ncbi:hypothetical protein [Tenacibaculum salmonis]|uniref:hypothetical protein n=1 Tax=Tenacibaculum sp. P3-BQ1 TaxID=3232310 RepID=UPI0034DF438A
MKKHKKKIFLIITFLFLVQQCTDINLIPAFVLNKSDYKYLSNNISSKNYVVNRISEYNYSFITYDTINNYFIMDDSYSKIKIDYKGDIKIKIPHPSGNLPYKTHYVFTDSTICDLSKDRLQMIQYYKKINPDKHNWFLLFEEYYNKATTVIYGNDDKIYLKIKEGWILFRTLNGPYLDGEHITEKTLKGYPAKYRKLIYLKDLKSYRYSDWSEERYYPEDKIKYLNQKIKKISFKKRGISETFTYTSIISQHFGIEYYKFKKRNEYIRFKESASKYPFIFFKSKRYVSHYNIPEKFKTKTEVSFMDCSYPSNQYESKSDGLYIVKPK